MKLLVFSHKVLWREQNEFVTDGGFPFQIKYISELFDETVLLAPLTQQTDALKGSPVTGNRLKIFPLSMPPGKDLLRKLLFPFWCLKHLPLWLREFFRADAVHAPIPGDVGTVGMLLAFIFQKPLFVRYCGNWFAQTTPAQHFWKWFMERFAGGRNVMLATGGADHPPSASNPKVGWIFATSLTNAELSNCGSVRSFPSHPRLIIVCRQDASKGTAIVLRACALLLDVYPGLSLDVVGAGTELAGLQQQAIQLGLQKQVRFHGQVNHEAVLELLQSANLFCYPTATEGFPKAVLEALATGLPVITTPVSVLPQLLAHGAGVLMRERTSEALAQAVQDCFSDPVRYESMSRAAIETAQKFSLESWRDQIGAHLEMAWGKLRTHA